MTKIAVIVSNGYEDLEFTASYDLLHRAGAELTLVSLEDSLTVKSLHGLTLECSAHKDVLKPENFDAFVIPGGYIDLDKYISLEPNFRAMLDAKKHLCAICAAPTALASSKVLQGKNATCYPSMSELLTNNGVEYHHKEVVVDGLFVTGHGPAASVKFALEVVNQVLGAEARKTVVEQIRHEC